MFQDTSQKLATIRSRIPDGFMDVATSTAANGSDDAGGIWLAELAANVICLAVINAGDKNRCRSEEETGEER